MSFLAVHLMFLRLLLGWVDSAFFCAGSVNVHLAGFLPSVVFDSVKSDLHGICSSYPPLSVISSLSRFCVNSDGPQSRCRSP